MVRQRARREGNFVMSWEGCSLQLLRALNLNSQQFVTFLQPVGQRLPSNEEEFYQLSGQLRRVGHVMEQAPNNLGQLLHGNRQARRGEYYTEGDQEQSHGSQDTSHQRAYPTDTGAQQGEGVLWPPAQSSTEPSWGGWDQTMTY